jgi:hypothetical protein
MKKYILGLIAIVMVGFASNAQDLKSKLEKNYGSLTSVDMPSEILTTQKSTFEQPIPIYVNGGTAIVVVNEFGIKCIYITSGVVLRSDYKSKLLQSKSILTGSDINSKGFNLWKWMLDILCDIFNCDN